MQLSHWIPSSSCGHRWPSHWGSQRGACEPRCKLLLERKAQHAEKKRTCKTWTWRTMPSLKCVQETNAQRASCMADLVACFSGAWTFSALSGPSSSGLSSLPPDRKTCKESRCRNMLTDLKQSWYVLMIWHIFQNNSKTKLLQYYREATPFFDHFACHARDCSLLYIRRSSLTLATVPGLMSGVILAVLNLILFAAGAGSVASWPQPVLGKGKNRRAPWNPNFFWWNTQPLTLDSGRHHDQNSRNLLQERQACHRLRDALAWALPCKPQV